MKMRMTLSNIDLGDRFNISEGSVTNIFIAWINYLYVTWGSLKVWPHRDIIIANSLVDFKEKYPSNLIIIDATESKVHMLSALQIK